MEKRNNQLIKNIFGSILVVLIFFVSFISLINLTFSILYTKTRVVGLSMYPTINSGLENDSIKGDTIYINEYEKFERNDIVVAEVDWWDNCIVKRLVGVPGDKIEIKDENNFFNLYVNDNLLYSREKTGENKPNYKTETYEYYDHYIKFLNNPENKHIIVHEHNNKYIQLRENDYFVMGDNWGHTTDSLINGPIKKSNIIGKVDLIVDVENKNPFTAFNFFIKKLFSV